MYNVDGTMNQGGSITHETTMMMSHKGHCEKAVFEVCDLGKSNIIIGFTWLKKHNPEINWKTGNVQFTRCPQECTITIREYKKKHANAFKYRASIEEVDDDVKESEIEDDVDVETEEDIYLWVLEYIHTVDECVKVEKTVEEIVPPAFHAYLDVFRKEPSERMPTRKPWDHAIDLMPDFVPKKSKIFPLSPDECEEMLSFVRDQLQKGYIRLSSSPQMSPMFFVPKPETTAKHMCTDYRHLNKKTIKNNYPLPLISEMIDRIGDAKVFTKLDL